MRQRSIAQVVEVRPLPHLPALRLGEGSSSANQHHEIAYATDNVYDRLIESESQPSAIDRSIYVAIQWPEERRIAGKGKNRSLVIPIRRLPENQVRPAMGSFP